MQIRQTLKNSSIVVDQWYIDNLVCPIDKSKLILHGNYLVSDAGRRYPVVDGIPVMLVESATQTIEAATSSLTVANRFLNSTTENDRFFIDTLNLTETERHQLFKTIEDGNPSEVDPVISFLVGATNGMAYKNLRGRLKRLPIPDIPSTLNLPTDGNLLDIGSNWGRWSISAGLHRNGLVVGLDPTLGAIAAARRLAAQKGVYFRGVVGDARFLPFKEQTFTAVFSYSVLQHLARADAASAVSEISRILAPNGICVVQMPNRNGIRCLWHQFRRSFAEGEGFDVRYWSLAQLRSLFKPVGSTIFKVDCFLGIGLQAADLDMLTGLGRTALLFSERLKNAFGTDGFITHLADSVWVVSKRS